MKILTSKEQKAIFNDMMTLTLIASEATRMLAMGIKAPLPGEMVQQQSLILELNARISYALRGMFGMVLSRKIQDEYLERLLKEQDKEVTE